MKTSVSRFVSRAVLTLGASLSVGVYGEATMQLTSTAFSHHSAIPAVHTCEGRDMSPPLSWSGAPERTRSFALIVDDPDAPDPAAPKMTWVHWVVFNIPPDVASLVEGASGGALPSGAVEGLNDWHHAGYRGPCPPIGRHRYVHKLYALDTLLPVTRSATKTVVEREMKGHILAKSELIGIYQKKGAQ